MHARIHHEKSATVEEVARVCDEMNARARTMIAQRMSDHEIYETLRHEFADLAETYPVIISNAALGDYDRAVVRKFLRHVQTHLWHNEDEYLDMQAQYHVMLYHANCVRSGAHYGAADTARVRSDARNAMDADLRRLKDIASDSKKVADANNSRRALARREELRAMLMASRDTTREAALLGNSPPASP